MEPLIPQYQKCVDYFRKMFFNKIDADCWIAGGALRDYFTLGWFTTDLDVYFPNESELLSAAKRMIELGYQVDYESENSIKFSLGREKVDFVKVYFDSPEQTFATFDFTCVCAAVSRDDVFVHPTFFMDLTKKELILNKLWKPLGTLKRLQKYAKKGFVMPNDQLLILALAIKECEDLDSYDVADVRKIAQSMSVGVNAAGEVVESTYADKSLKRGNKVVISQKLQELKPIVPAEVDDTPAQYFEVTMDDRTGKPRTNFYQFVTLYQIFEDYPNKRQLLVQWHKEKRNWQQKNQVAMIEARQRGESVGDRITGNTAWQISCFDPILRTATPKPEKTGLTTADIIKRKIREQKKTEAYVKDTTTPIVTEKTEVSEQLAEAVDPEKALGWKNGNHSKAFDSYPSIPKE